MPNARPPFLCDDEINLNMSPELRPKVARELGLPLGWDLAIDQLPAIKPRRLADIVALGCQIYRRFRPDRIGNRCCFEPSCSRYCEICFRLFGLRTGAMLSYRRLTACRPPQGGIDLPPGISDFDSLLNGIGCNEISR